MSAALLVAGLTLLGGFTAPDSAVALHRGDAVEVRDFGGSIHVQAWSRSQLDVGGEDVEDGSVSITRSGSRVLVEPARRRGRRMDVDMTLRLPPWVTLEIQGREVDVDVSGMAAAVSVRNVSGDIEVRGTTGDIDLNSVEGEIVVTDAQGRVSAQSRGDDVSLTRVVGDVDARTGNGDVRLEDIRATSVRAETLDGDVFFSGSLMAGGRYGFSVHDGDATLVIPRSSDAHVSVATYDGEFSSDFPVTLQHYTGEGRFEFTVGRGGAEVSVEVFDGEIRVRARDGS